MVAKILQFKQPEKREPKKKRKESTGVIRKPGSDNLYIELYPNGIREQISSKMADTPENEQILVEWVKAQKKKMEEGTFCFAKAFPAASERKKRLHSTLEGRTYFENLGEMSFVDYLERWQEVNLDPVRNPGKKAKYDSRIDYWFKPFFKGYAFNDITGAVLKQFMKHLVHKNGKHKGQPLAKSSTRQIMGILQGIWEDAAEEYQWDRSSPFNHIKKFTREDIRHRPKADRATVFRFDEWERIMDNIFPRYKPMIGLMVRTGMIQSEINGLKRPAIRNGYLHVEYSVTRYQEKAALKNEFRQRKIPITKAIQDCLDQAAYLSNSEFFFRSARGNAINGDSFSSKAWKTALKKAGVKYTRPYTMRHTFTAWALAIGMKPNQLVNLMGHSSKKQIYETYGNYVEGLNKDVSQIMEYFGNDFLQLSS